MGNPGSGDIYLSSSASFAPSPTRPSNGSNLPHRHPSFVGREKEIQKVISALCSIYYAESVGSPRTDVAILVSAVAHVVTRTIVILIWNDDEMVDLSPCPYPSLWFRAGS